MQDVAADEVPVVAGEVPVARTHSERERAADFLVRARAHVVLRRISVNTFRMRVGGAAATDLPIRLRPLDACAAALLEERVERDERVREVR